MFNKRELEMNRIEAFWSLSGTQIAMLLSDLTIT